MLTVLDLAQEDIQFNQRVSTRREKKGPCPGCGGKDRFSVKQDDNGRWVFMCRGCYDAQGLLPDKGRKRGWGDEINYLRHYRGMSYQQARALVGDETVVQAHCQNVTRATNWQEIISSSVKESEIRLWSDDTTALDYVRGRGLSDDTIKGAHLGYSIKDGITRLVIPSYNEGRYVAVYRRDLRVDIDHSQRWMDVAGSSKDELYLADCLQIRRPTLLVEAPLCALTIVQECGNLVNAVATGGVDGARSPKSLAQLALMPLVLVAFDADARGDECAPYWLERLPKSRRLRPLLKDINDMLIDGWDIRAWVEQAIQDLQPATRPEPVISQAPVEQPKADQKQTKSRPDYSEISQRVPIDALLGYSGLPLPDEILMAIEQTVQPCSVCLDLGLEVPAIGDDGEFMYCAEHLPVVVKMVDPLDNEVVQAVSKRFNASLVEIIPTSELARRKIEIPREMRAQMVNTTIKRGRIRQRLVDQWIEQGGAYTGLDGQKGDYWTISTTHLEKIGFREQMIASDKRIKNLVLPPRVYPCPVPRYELIEIDGMKHLTVAGYWNEQVSA